MPNKKTKVVSFEAVLQILADEQVIIPTNLLPHFSDLEGNNLNAFKSLWKKISHDRKISFLSDMTDWDETDTLVNFESVAHVALQDPDGQVRAKGIKLLNNTEDPKLVPILANILKRDPEEKAREAAAVLLGKFIYLGELEEIPEQIYQMALDALFLVPQTESEIVRQRVLESIGYSSNSEVSERIEAAYNLGKSNWKESALRAMGRSADEHWEKLVLENLDHDIFGIQLAAVEAAGELELKKAKKALTLLLKDAQNLEPRLFSAVVWSLSQIGGENVKSILEALADMTEDDATLEIIEDALDNLELNEMFAREMFDFTKIDDEDHETLIDLDDENEDDDGSDEDDHFLNARLN